MARTREGGGSLKCSFCGKSQNDVRKLIAGPTVYICDECIELCNDIIAEEWEEEKSRDIRSLPKPAEIKFACSCPDYASMCKHVAASLMGVGVRLDAKP